MKTMNYTVEQTKSLVEKYQANPSAETIANLAKEFGKTAKSIVAKLSREGAYKAATKAKVERVTKADLAKELNQALKTNINLEDLTVLKADVLKTLIEALETD